MKTRSGSLFTVRVSLALWKPPIGKMLRGTSFVGFPRLTRLPAASTAPVATVSAAAPRATLRPQRLGRSAGFDRRERDVARWVEAVTSPVPGRGNFQTI